MVKQRTRFYREFVAPRTRRSRVIHRGFVFVMFAVVLYDSFVHDLPFYYILFALAGLLVQRVIRSTRKVDLNDDGLLQEHSGLAWLFVFAVLALRLPFGDWALQKVHVVWLSDALYLFSLGLHFARLKSISIQVDELVYGLVIRSQGGAATPQREQEPDSDSRT